MHARMYTGNDVEESARDEIEDCGNPFPETCLVFRALYDALSCADFSSFSIVERLYWLDGKLIRSLARMY